VSASYRPLPGCLCLHGAPIFTSIGVGRQVACGWFNPIVFLLRSYYVQTHEVIGSPPNVSVPTHFAKVVLASRVSSPATPDILEISTGAFVLPNAIIPDEAPLESFVMPGKLLLFCKL